MKKILVIQGPTKFQREMVDHYSKMYDTFIWSTWTNEDVSYIKNKKNIILIINDLPIHYGIGNINLQLKSSLYGVQAAKQLGYTHCMKIRSDILFYDDLLNIMHDTKPSFICGHTDYLVDYVFGGTIDFMIDICSSDVINVRHNVPERILLANMKTKKYTDVYSMLPCLTKAFWLKRGYDIVTEILTHSNYVLVNRII